ncbi:MSHA biogenesis protein MshP [Massilia sp. erpn]|uniref:MSHA biogenesis protein MshP n=1 Tax=Massilia sp. erpn TaxID=2738142 RepID=UPI0021035B63|nr:MSHA biogenesis protein MshP [Massilia sp. erpn]UTY59875.1 MSHA biogenesis protein MshP [Massilia sp. erpn]
MRNRQKQGGFGVIAAVIILVMLSAFAAAVLRTTSGQQAATNLDIAASNAFQAARAGTEWGLYQALVLNTCQTNQQLNLAALNGFTVTVNCSRITIREGETAPGQAEVKTIFTVDAVACNTAGPCPANASAATPDYVERRHMAAACMTATLGACYN